MTQARLPHRDDGFTLVEVALTMAIIGAVTVALAAVVIIVFKTNEGIATASTSARDKELVGLYFTRDVESATSLATAGPWACASHALLEVSRPDYTVDYVVRPGRNGRAGTLTRRSCHFGVSLSTDTLVRSLDTAAYAPTLTCTPDSTCVGSNESVTLTFQLIHEGQPYSVAAYKRSSEPPPSGGTSQGTG